MAETSKKVKPPPRRKAKPYPKQPRFSPWLRLYVDMLDDHKVQTLPLHLFKAWVCLLAMAKVHDGTLPSANEIAFRLRMSQHDAQAAIDSLIDKGLIDIRPDKHLEPHNWAKRQFRWDGVDLTQAERKRRSRARDGSGHGRVTDDVTVDVTENDSDSVSVSESVFSTTVDPSEDSNRATYKEDTGRTRRTNVAKWVGPNDEEVL